MNIENPVLAAIDRDVVTVLGCIRDAGHEAARKFAIALQQLDFGPLMSMQGMAILLFERIAARASFKQLVFPLGEGGADDEILDMTERNNAHFITQLLAVVAPEDREEVIRAALHSHRKLVEERYRSLI